MTVMVDLAEQIRTRVREKKKDYKRYNFKKIQDDAFKTFFDLAQEYATLDNLVRISVTVPKEFFNLDSNLYLINIETGQLELICTSKFGMTGEEFRKPEGIYVNNHAYSLGQSFVVPIRGNKLLIDKLPFYSGNEVLGMFEVYPSSHLTPEDRFYLEKYANRIGYNLHNKIIAEQNIRHIKFINHLASNIEHNVINPNMHYRLFLLKLKKEIKRNQMIEDLLRKLVWGTNAMDAEIYRKIWDICIQLISVNRGLNEQHANVKKHHQHMSLFLESLFRKHHFECGQFILRKNMCDFKTEIIDPQLDRFKDRFTSRGIFINNELDADKDLQLSVDKGLIAQVYANLFSNAERYTEEVHDGYGNKVKFISCGWEKIKDFFGCGTDGIKFNVYTTGFHISEEDSKKVFEEGFRGSNAQEERGTGHGLHFVKNVIEVHGGVVGYEPKSLGNNFYFILLKRAGKTGIFQFSTNDLPKSSTQLLTKQRCA